MSWNYFYVVLGFALSIVATIISMESIWRVLVFLVFAAALIWLILFHGQTQNWLIKLKTWYESREH